MIFVIVPYIFYIHNYFRSKGIKPKQLKTTSTASEATAGADKLDALSLPEMEFILS